MGVISALFNEKYRRASWVNLVYIVLHGLIGQGVIIMYSNQILQDMPGGYLNARQSTYLVGIVNLIAAAMSIKTVRSFGRIPLLAFGHFSIAIVHGLIGYFALKGNNFGILINLLVFLVLY